MDRGGIGMNSKKLIRKLWKMFPSKIAKQYHDYVGLMVAHLREETSSIVVCLDVTPKAIDTAIARHADLIISHHPFLYGKRSEVLKDPYRRSLFRQLSDASIPVYSFHTNFDEGKFGMNDALAERLKLKDVRPIPDLPMGRMGELQAPTDIRDFAKEAVRLLDLDYGQLIACGKKEIRTVGIIGGAGSRESFLALTRGCDIFLSGDTPYHVRRELRDRGYNYLHVDHEIEKIFVSQMKKILLSIDDSLKIIEVDDVTQSELILRAE